MKHLFHQKLGIGPSSWLSVFFVLVFSFLAKSQNACFEIRFSTENAQIGDTIEVKVSIRGFQDINSYQFAMQWLPTELQYLQYNTTGSALSAQLFGSGSVGQGIFRTLWSDPSGYGVTLADDAILFKIYFKVLAASPGFYSIKIDPGNNPTIYEVVNGLNQRLPLVNIAGGARINMPGSLAISALCATVPSCAGISGAVQCTPTGGLPPYHYYWTGANGFVSQDSVLSGFPAGYYSLTLTDAAGSLSGAIVGFYQFGTTITAYVSSTQKAKCSLPNGCANVSVVGGSPPYSFNWSQPGSATADRCDLQAGYVQVTVSDAKGCLTVADMVIEKDSLLNVDLDSLNADCRFDQKGGVLLHADGVAPYIFQWSNGDSTQNLADIGPGKYTVTATDALGCHGVKTAQVKDYGTFDWSLYLDKTCQNTFFQQAVRSSGNLTVRSYDFASRAKFPLTLSWSNGTRQNVQTLDDDEFYKNLGMVGDLDYGRYAVTVTDAEGCSEIRETLVECTNPDGIKDARPRFYIQDRELSSAYLDSCVEVFARHSYYLTQVDFGIKWSEYYLNFKEIKFEYPTIKPENITLHNGSLDFHWEYTNNGPQFPNYSTLFKICFDKGPSSINPDVEFTWGQQTPAIVHQIDGNLGFIGMNGRVNFTQPYSYGTNFIDVNLLQPSCKNEGYGRIELGEPYWSNNDYQNVSGKYNSIPFTGPERLRLALPGRYEVTQQGGASGLSSSLFAYIPPYSLPATECVWPGDADNNSVVNHFDLLYLGLGLGHASAPRSDLDSIWQGYDAADWPISTPSHLVNFKNLDLDGNGFIEAADTLTLLEHWGKKIHPFGDETPYDMPYLPDTLVSQAKVGFQADTVWAGATIKIPLTFAADGILGLAFSVSYDSVLVVSDVRFEPADSWLGDPLEDLICAQKDFQAQSRLDIALTRSDGQAAGGAGKIGDLILKFEDLAPDSLRSTVLFTAQACGITPTEKRIALGETRQEIVLRGQIKTHVFSPQQLSQAISLSPNPVSEILFLVSHATPIRRVEVSSLDGVVQLVSTPGNPVQEVQLELEKLPAGTYFARIFCAEGVVVKKFVVGR